MASERYTTEEYQVDFDQQKEDGTWERHKRETVFLQVRNNFKNNHDQAAERVKAEYPGCSINTVYYC